MSDPNPPPPPKRDVKRNRSDSGSSAGSADEREGPALPRAPRPEPKKARHLERRGFGAAAAPPPPSSAMLGGGGRGAVFDERRASLSDGGSAGAGAPKPPPAFGGGSSAFSWGGGVGSSASGPPQVFGGSSPFSGGAGPAVPKPPARFDESRASFPSAGGGSGGGDDGGGGGGAPAGRPPHPMNEQLARLERTYPQLAHASPRMYAAEKRRSMFGGASDVFSSAYNSTVLTKETKEGKRQTSANSGPPLVVNPDQGEDFATPPGSPRPHNTGLRTAVDDFDPTQDMMVNLGSPVASRRSSYNSYENRHDPSGGRADLEKPDRDQVRAQATLTNDYIAGQDGGSVTPSLADPEGVDAAATRLQGRSHTADKTKSVFPEGRRTFGHVPDKPLTNPRQAPSQMGVLPMSAAANNVTGDDSGLGGFVAQGRPVSRMLVRENDGQFYHYRSGHSGAGSAQDGGAASSSAGPPPGGPSGAAAEPVVQPQAAASSAPKHSTPKEKPPKPP